MVYHKESKTLVIITQQHNKCSHSILLHFQILHTIDEGYV